LLLLTEQSLVQAVLLEHRLQQELVQQLALRQQLGLALEG
jgi:hypothetical protein